MIELVSPQLAAASYISAVVTPTDVAMHADTNDDDSDDEETNGAYAARCNNDLDHLSNDELQSLVHTLSGQLKKAGKPAARGAYAAPPKKKTVDTLPPTPPVPSLPTPQPTASTNSTPDMSAIAKIVPKPAVPQTIMPQIRSADQKGKGKEVPGPDFHYQCPIEDKADAKKVFDRILNISIPVTAHELLSLSPDIHNKPKNPPPPKRLKQPHLSALTPSLSFYIPSMLAIAMMVSLSPKSHTRCTPSYPSSTAVFSLNAS